MVIIGDYGIIEGKRSNDFYTLLQKINNEIIEKSKKEDIDFLNSKK